MMIKNSESLIVDPDSMALCCFGPSLFSYNLLKVNMDLETNNHHIDFYQIGMGSRSCEDTLFVNEKGAATNSLYQRRGVEGVGIKYEQTEDVLISTVDEFSKANGVDRIYFLMIDTEGNEFHVLQGARAMLEERSIDFIQFESGGCWIDSRIFEII